MPTLIPIFQEKTFKIDADPQGDQLNLIMTGQVNEDVDFNKALTVLGSVTNSVKTVHFNVRGISQINSCGVRSWLLFLEKIQAKYDCIFEEIGEVFTEQANIVPNMLGKSGTPVTAFETPFFCPQCSTRTLKMLKSSEITLSGEQFGYPHFKCEKCGTPLEFDALEEEYFNFLKRART